MIPILLIGVGIAAALKALAFTASYADALRVEREAKKVADNEGIAWEDVVLLETPLSKRADLLLCVLEADMPLNALQVLLHFGEQQQWVIVTKKGEPPLMEVLQEALRAPNESTWGSAKDAAKVLRRRLIAKTS